MNKLLPYERKIAEGLKELPQPVMEDTIWARIEKMLDADGSVENSEAEASSSSVHKKTSSRREMTAGIIIIIAAMVAVIIINKRSKKNRLKVNPEINMPSKSSGEEKNVIDSDKNINYPGPSKRNGSANPGIKTQQLNIDSTVTIPFTPVTASSDPKIDSSNNSHVIKPFKKDSTLKVPRGVQGISDSDYRFKNDKKDSIKN